MKKRIAYLLCLSALILGGCSRFTRGRKSSSISSSEETTSSEKTTSSSSSSSSGGQEGELKIEIYSSNDIHGQIMDEGGRSGLLSYASYFKEKRNNPNTLLLDQGDTWQGSIYSNHNHGELLTDVMNYIQFDARTVGNHDFDWGMQYIENNAKRKYNGYATPVLAGNVYDFNFETKEVGSHQQSNLGTTSITKVLDNGLKVGILGGIGIDQITSISSNFTENIAFTDHVQFIKDEATHLRNDEHCDVVIASIHTGQESMLYNGLNQYVDLVLCGHTHRQETFNEGLLYYVQSKAYAQSFSHITLTYDTEVKDVISTKVESIPYYVVDNEAKIDSTIQSLYNEYVSRCEEEANEVVANNVSGYFYSNEYAENVMARAIYDQAKEEGYGICLSYVNVARHSLPSDSWTYADLYQSFPFDNEIYIVDITGREFMYEIVNYNFIYRDPNFTTNTIDPNQTYRIAVIDYLYFHTNTSRYYDYFSETGGTSNVKLSKNYRVILRDWLKKNGYATGKNLSTSDYSKSLWQHDSSVFTY